MSLFIFVCLDLQYMLLVRQVLRIGKEVVLVHQIANDRQHLCLLCLWNHSWKEIFDPVKSRKIHFGYVKFLSRNRLNLRHEKRYFDYIWVLAKNIF